MPQRNNQRQNTQSRKPRPQLTPFEKGQILQASRDGYSAHQIAQDFDREPSTITRWLKKASSQPQGQSLPRTGRPKSWSVRDQRRITRLIRQHPFWSYKRVKRELRLKLSVTTIHRIIQPLGIKK